MAIVSLPLPRGAEARLLLRRLLHELNILGRDAAGRIIIQFAVDDWALDRLMSFDAGAAPPDDAAGGSALGEELVPTPVLCPPGGGAGNRHEGSGGGGPAARRSDTRIRWSAAARQAGTGEPPKAGREL